jgi:hypothetical protein
VLVRHALVAEVLAELVHALEPADDEALQVQLRRDPQVQRLVELVVMRRERARERASVPRLQDRRLDLDEAVLVEGATDRAHHPRPQEEVGPRLLVHQQVEVPAPVALLDVGEAVEGVGQRRADPRERLQPGHGDGRLASPRPHRASGDADDVAQVELVHDAPHILLLDDELDPAGPVDEVEKDDPAVAAAGHHAAREPDLLGSGGAGWQRLGGTHHGGGLDPIGEALRRHRPRV